MVMGGWRRERHVRESRQPEVLLIDVDRISPSPYQARSTPDHELLRDLAESIKTHGVLQPILVRALAGGSYELIAGERRLRAARLAGLDRIPANVRVMSERDRAVVGMVENLQREDLNCLEEADGYARLISEFGLTQDQLAREIGKSQPTVANKLRLLKLGEEVKRALRDGHLSETHGRALLRIEDTACQAMLADRIVNERISVRNTERLVEEVVSGGRAQRPGEARMGAHSARRRVKGAYRDLRIFLNSFRHAVDTLRESGVDAEMVEREAPDGIEVVVRIRTAAVRSRQRRAAGAGADVLDAGGSTPGSEK
jgi:ParB family chromosome partitioning protein